MLVCPRTNGQFKRPGESIGYNNIAERFAAKNWERRPAFEIVFPANERVRDGDAGIVGNRKFRGEPVIQHDVDLLKFRSQIIDQGSDQSWSKTIALGGKVITGQRKPIATGPERWSASKTLIF
jgi:hypothetical protein